MARVACALILSLAAVPGARPQDTAQTSPPPPPPGALPLFSDHQVLRLTLETDLRTLLRDRGENRKEHPARLSYVDATGTRVSVPLEVRTRGNFRLRRMVCAFPPIRLDFPKDSTPGTLFAGQDKVKLVTHCQNRRSYEQAVLHEYLIYRILNLSTDVSYRARLVRMTYIDTSGREDSLTRYAILLESDEALAGRHGVRVFDQKGVTQEMTDPEQMTLVALFQYLIGNTDWSVAALHNITVLTDSLGRFFAVPYDFDWSGLISAPYAFPDPRIGTKTVRERVYRGYCRAPEEIAPLLQRFASQKDAIYALYRSQEGLERQQLEQALRYFDEFFRVLADPRAARREFSRNCPGG
ncbi:MAG TPA: hypothetical protein VNI61_05955 [Gemmatimonadales bacterium]|nr:hypothetical protein [Gemmatimonadales bacterium]